MKTENRTGKKNFEQKNKKMKTKVKQKNKIKNKLTLL